MMDDELPISDEWDPVEDEVNVFQIVSAITQTEVIVPLTWENPEAALLHAAAEYLESLGTRVPLVAFTTTYTDQPHPMLVGTIFTAPVIDDGPLLAMDQKDK